MGSGPGYRIAAEAGFSELAFRRGGDRVAVAIPGSARTEETVSKG